MDTYLAKKIKQEQAKKMEAMLLNSNKRCKEVTVDTYKIKQ